jgi:hypothetical protein
VADTRGSEQADQREPAAFGGSHPVCSIDWMSRERDYRPGMGTYGSGKRTARINRTKYGTSRGVPLNADAVAVLEEVVGNHPEFCFAFRGVPIRWDVTNRAWHPAIKNSWTYGCALSRFASHWGSWHRQARTSCDELKDLGGWKSRQMVDRYAKFATENRRLHRRGSSRVSSRTT